MDLYPDQRRRESYVWVTWIAGLLSGDEQCAWRSWFKAHFRHDRLPDPRENDLTRWKADHAERVRALADQLAGDGWRVSLEEQNKLRVRGRIATVAGAPDIIAERDGALRVIDVKTGARRDRDYWQVVVYLLLLRLTGRLGERAATGELSYTDGPRIVALADAEQARERVFGAIGLVGGPTELARVPSEGECARCDVASCPDRVRSTTLDVETEEF